MGYLERYIRDGHKALWCRKRADSDPPCGECEGCITAQIIHGIRSK